MRIGKQAKKKTTKITKVQTKVENSLKIEFKCPHCLEQHNIVAPVKWWMQRSSDPRPLILHCTRSLKALVINNVSLCPLSEKGATGLHVAEWT